MVLYFYGSLLMLQVMVKVIGSIKLTSHIILTHKIKSIIKISQQLQICSYHQLCHQENPPKLYQIYQHPKLIILLMPTLSEQFIQKAILNPLQDQKCWQLHPGLTCNQKMLYQFASTCRNLYKMYLLVHLIPFLVFKRKKLKQKPVEEIKKLVIAFVKSMLFAGGYTLVVRRTICFFTEHYKFSSVNGVLGAFLGGSTLIFQPAGRQAQIALFCVNKTLETLYHMGRRRNYPIRIPYGQCLLVGVSIAIICYHYMDCPQAIRQNYKKVLEKLLGNI